MTEVAGIRTDHNYRGGQPRRGFDPTALAQDPSLQNIGGMIDTMREENQPNQANRYNPGQYDDAQDRPRVNVVNEGVPASVVVPEEGVI